MNASQKHKNGKPFYFFKKMCKHPDAQKSKKVKQLSKTAKMCKSKEKR